MKQKPSFSRTSRAVRIATFVFVVLHWPVNLCGESNVCFLFCSKFKKSIELINGRKYCRHKQWLCNGWWKKRFNLIYHINGATFLRLTCHVRIYKRFRRKENFVACTLFCQNHVSLMCGHDKRRAFQYQIQPRHNHVEKYLKTTIFSYIHTYLPHVDDRLHTKVW
jgi:hypothetical protein